MLTHEDINEIPLPLLPLKDPYGFARAIEAAVRKICEVDCAQAVRYARAEELEECIKVCTSVARDEEYGHMYSDGAGEVEGRLWERRKTPND